VHISRDWWKPLHDIPKIGDSCLPSCHRQRSGPKSSTSSGYSHQLTPKSLQRGLNRLQSMKLSCTIAVVCYWGSNVSRGGRRVNWCTVHTSLTWVLCAGSRNSLLIIGLDHRPGHNLLVDKRHLVYENRRARLRRKENQWEVVELLMRMPTHVKICPRLFLRTSTLIHRPELLINCKIPAENHLLTQRIQQLEHRSRALR